jgi:hypothetical protein
MVENSIEDEEGSQSGGECGQDIPTAAPAILAHEEQAMEIRFSCPYGRSLANPPQSLTAIAPPARRSGPESSTPQNIEHAAQRISVHLGIGPCWVEAAFCAATTEAPHERWSRRGGIPGELLALPQWGQ